MKFSKLIIIILLILIVIFVSSMSITYWIMGDVPESLISAVATMVTAEGGFLMLIKNIDTWNNRHKEREDDIDDRFNTDSYDYNYSDTDFNNGISDSVPEREDR